MAGQVQILRVVIASPGDVTAERERVPVVIDEINRSVASDRGLRLEAIRWETDTYPGLHPEGPQGLIDPILRIEDCDILVGIFWKRFGTPTYDAGSGAEHEFRRAYAAWKEHRKPQIMVYFNEKPYSPKSKEETTQWGDVLEFRKAFPKEGLWWSYKGASQFEKLLRMHLSNFLRDCFPVSQTRRDPDAGVAEGSTAYFTVQRRIIQDHARTFIGRQSTVQAFDRFVDTHKRGYFIVRGGPGLGKTAFSSHLVTTRKYIHHFISRTGGRTDTRLILRSLLSQLPSAARTSERFPDSLSELTKLFEDGLAKVATPRNKAAIVIDALDELPGDTTDTPPYLVSDAVPEGTLGFFGASYV